LKIRENGGDAQQPVPLVCLKELTSDSRGAVEIEELMGQSKNQISSKILDNVQIAGYEIIANLKEFFVLFDNQNKVYIIKDLIKFK
jgi:hypothetical protein